MDRARRNLLIGGSAIVAVGGLLPTACAMRRMTRNQGPMMTGTPKRPPGQPKLMLDEDIGPVLARLDAWYAAHAPSLLRAPDQPA